MASAHSELDCPVCHEELTAPKLLRCLHVVCRQCTLQWLTKSGPWAGCPLCREVILPLPPQDDQGNLGAMVDRLPTDVVTEALVENRRVLHGPHQCGVCSQDQAATAYCFHCRVKLCTDCRKHHELLPVISNHTVKDVNKVTTDQLAAFSRYPCPQHPNSPVELYCGSHQQLMCASCFASAHRACADLTDIPNAADKARNELQRHVRKMEDLHERLATQMQGIRDTWTSVEKQVDGMFNDLQHLLDKQRQEICTAIQEWKRNDLVFVAEVDRLHARVKSHLAATERLLADTTRDDALLQMAAQLTTCLIALEADSDASGKMAAPVSQVTFDPQVLAMVKVSISQLGKMASLAVPQRMSLRTISTIPTCVTTSTGTNFTSAVFTPSIAITNATPSLTTSVFMPSTLTSSDKSPKPTGAVLAKCLKVGDRVKKARGWGDQGPGTVTAIPSRLSAARGWDPYGMVDVRWDCSGQEWHYSMGLGDEYSLELL